MTEEDEQEKGVTVEVVVRMVVYDEDLDDDAIEKVAAECVQDALEEWNTAGTYDDVQVLKSSVVDENVGDG